MCLQEVWWEPSPARLFELPHDSPVILVSHTSDHTFVNDPGHSIDPTDLAAGAVGVGRLVARDVAVLVASVVVAVMRAWWTWETAGPSALFRQASSDRGSRPITTAASSSSGAGRSRSPSSTTLGRAARAVCLGALVCGMCHACLQRVSVRGHPVPPVSCAWAVWVRRYVPPMTAAEGLYPLRFQPLVIMASCFRSVVWHA